MIKINKENENLIITFNYNPEYVERIKELPTRKYDKQNKQWKVPIEHVDKVINKFEDIKININSEAITKNKLMEEEDVNKELNFYTKPFPHQEKGIKDLMNYKSRLLADDQGLGKTKQTLDLIRNKKDKINKSLIIVGINGLKYNWADEIETHAPDFNHKIIGIRKKNNGKTREGTLEERLEDIKNIENDDNDIYIINIHSIRYPEIKKDEKLDKTKKAQKDIVDKLEEYIKKEIINLVTVDEIHKAKNAMSQQGKGLQKLNSEYKLALTGTPIENKPLDAYAILKWLGEEQGSYYLFEQRYCEKGGFKNKEIIGFKNLDELHKRVNKIQLRRLKEDVLDLPEKLYHNEYVEMYTEQQKLYNKVRDQLLEELDKLLEAPNPLVKLLRLRQATGTPKILDEEINKSAKVDKLKELIKDAIELEEKIIIYSNWTQVTNQLEEELIKEYSEDKIAYVTGELKDEEKDKEIKRFKNDENCKIIIGTTSALGTGYTLTPATKVIFFDKPYNPSQFNQAIDRVHRIGTTGTINVISLITKNSIDEWMEELLKKKENYFEGIVNGKLDKLSKTEVLKDLIS